MYQMAYYHWNKFVPPFDACISKWLAALIDLENPKEVSENLKTLSFLNFMFFPAILNDDNYHIREERFPGLEIIKILQYLRDYD
jgi:hypothetical protein